jgi:hypothetical protein
MLKVRQLKDRPKIRAMNQERQERSEVDQRKHPIHRLGILVADLETMKWKNNQRSENHLHPKTTRPGLPMQMVFRTS